ncbi:hypothetical protein EJ08DRAFT_162482 [Tothia fuscella]|uniref:Uncharacterized protein n=1 Tax=Tothia fuscella TaxID=1048955 RepID=A0A9P4NTU4_9PEZI|nr:hypothetical protein EJ08DRAFT_162482 [Tothia fuscella]
MQKFAYRRPSFVDYISTPRHMVYDELERLANLLYMSDKDSNGEDICKPEYLPPPGGSGGYERSINGSSHSCQNRHVPPSTKMSNAKSPCVGLPVSSHHGSQKMASPVRILPVNFMDEIQIYDDIKSLQEHLLAVQSTYRFDMAPRITVDLEDILSEPFLASEYRNYLENKVATVYNFLRANDGNLATSIRIFARHHVKRLANLPLRPETSLHLFALLVTDATRILVQLDDGLLSASIKLFRQGIPINDFPESMLNRVPRVFYEPQWHKESFKCCHDFLGV